MLLARSKQSLFSLPPAEVVAGEGEDLSNNYTHRNYFKSGPIGWIKRRRFEIALRLAEDTFGGKVIDMGCADGVLLSSLSKHFSEVVAMDYQPFYVEHCQKLVQRLGATNVSVMCNRDRNPLDLRDEIGSGFKTMFCLETLEHVGSQPDMWGEKMKFLDGCLSMLDVDGKVVISVPKMVGLSLLVKHAIQRSMGIYHDRMPLKELMRSVFLKNTDRIEPLWDGGHVGFNHLKLDRKLADRFSIIHRSETPISVFYVIQRKAVRRPETRRRVLPFAWGRAQPDVLVAARV